MQPSIFPSALSSASASAIPSGLPSVLPSVLPSACASALGALAAALCAAACTKDLLPSHDVELEVLGNPSPVTIALEWDGGTETLSLGTDAKGVFAAQMAVGTGIVLRGPTDCRFRNGDSAIAVTTTNQATKIRLACLDALELSDLGLSLPLVVSRDNLTYQIVLGALAADAAPIITAQPTPRYPGVTVEINGTGNGDGDLTTDRLKLGSNRVDVIFDEFLLRRSYTVVLQRATSARELKRLAGATASGGLGGAVAAEGDVLVIGEPGAAFGRAYVYRAEIKATGTSWALVDTLDPGGGAGAQSGFGEALAISGNFIAVGAPRDGDSDVGAVYVYGKQGADWVFLRRHTSGLPNSRFGEAVALSPAGALVVGVPGEAAGAANAGSVFLYAKADEAGRINITPPNRSEGDLFGHSVAFVGTSILVGAPGDDDGSPTADAPPVADSNNLTDAGAVYAFSSTCASACALTKYLKQATPVADARFGERLAGKGGALAVVRSKPSPSVDCFGVTLAPRGTVTVGFAIAALAVDADRIAVSHPSAGSGTDLRASAYRLKADGSNPDTMSPLFVGTGAAGADRFGHSLAFGGDLLYVGAPRQGAQLEGAFYVFE